MTKIYSLSQTSPINSVIKLNHTKSGNQITNGGKQIMKKRFKKLIALGLVAMMSLSLVACTSGEKKKMIQLKKLTAKKLV